ncbi:polysaccharide pyruvyl transferase family protein [Vibrio parahaemolyticus]
MLKVVVAPACTDLNRGDQALVWESVRFANELDKGNVDCRIIDTGDTEEERELQSSQTKAEGYNLLRNILGHPRRGKTINSSEVHDGILMLMSMAFYAILDFFVLNLLVLFPSAYKLLLKCEEKRKAFLFIKECDFVFIKGGGFLHTYGSLTDLYYIWYQTYYILLGARMKKKVIILPNSFGPFVEKSLATRYLKFVLNKCAKIYARERISLSILKEKLALENCAYAPDFGYFTSKISCQDFDHLDRVTNKKVAITVRPYRFPKSDNPSERYQAYINAVANFSDWLSSEKNCEVYFITQVKGPSAHEDDNIAIKDIRDITKNKNHHIDIDEDYRKLACLYSKFDVVTGTRFHSVIFSQVYGVPAFAIAYGGNKSRGIMRELGLEDYVVDIENTDPQLLKDMYLKLERNQTTYLESLSIAQKNNETIRSKMLREVVDV